MDAPSDPYLAPELVQRTIVGEREDGKRVRTSQIIAISGTSVTTESGSEYKLLKPKDDYIQFVEEYYDEKWDWENNPLRYIK